jgi:crotonobetainyl-CoA:carnitine CoA-transferase CaiB-like acyl-CoA transferase
VACIEAKFYNNFLAVLKDKCNLSVKDYQYLLGNQLNEDEWPEMKMIIQATLQKYSYSDLEKFFHLKDCCVQRVLSPDEALKSQIANEIVVRGKKAKQL